MLSYQPYELPEDFKTGTATSSLQIEGGDRNNSWYRWAEEGHIKDGTHCIVADDHWNRVGEDILLMQKLNVSVYRMSLEWSRIEPEEGKFDTEAIEHYRNEIKLLKERGIETLVTLHHFSNPLWFEDRDAWVNKESVELFTRYAENVVNSLGDLVSNWVTINEPNIYLIYGYIFGQWPPGKTKIGEFFKGARNMIKAHIRAYEKIHSVRRGLGFNDTRVGSAMHLRLFDPKSPSILDKIVCWLYDYLTQKIFLSGTIEGRLCFPLGFGSGKDKKRYSDFLGINYYSRDIVKFVFSPGEAFGRREVKKDAEVNDLGWEIYPEGLYRVCKDMYNLYTLPIVITENGTCDKEDAFRTKFIYDHLYQVKRLIDEGVAVKAYYHWTLMDNFEWAEGLSARFGLYHVDYETQKRTLRKSGRFFSELCEKKGVDEDMINKYLKD